VRRPGRVLAEGHEGSFANWRSVLPWMPQQLFDDINLPRLRVRWTPAYPGDKGEKEEDIALVFTECAPGNSTRRFNPARALWLPPPDPGPPGDAGDGPSAAPAAGPPKSPAQQRPPLLPG